MTTNENEIIDVIIYYPKEKWTSSLGVQPLGNNRFCIVDFDEFMDEPNLGDIIEAKQEKDGSYRFVQIVNKTDLVRGLLISGLFATTEPGKNLIRKIVNAGGYWELDAGYFFIALPPDHVHIFKELDQAYALFCSTPLPPEIVDAKSTIDKTIKWYKKTMNDKSLNEKSSRLDLVKRFKEYQ